MIFLKVFGWCVVFAAFFVATVGSFTSFENSHSRGGGWLTLGIISAAAAMAWVVQGLHWAQ